MPFLRWTSVFLLGICVTCASPGSADDTVTISPNAKIGTWEGWGASAAWWANQFGDRDDLADIAFTLKTVTWQGQPLPGLGLNIVRYNLGGCGQGMNRSPKIPAFKQIEAFWLDGKSGDPNSASFDWTRDVRQRALLQLAKERGADRFELFVDSPPWWMCANRNPSGSDNGADNLQAAYYEQFARFVAIATNQAKQQWQINFQSVAPFNEPSANWWRADGTQEGCHFEIATQQKVLKLLRKELNSRGLIDTKIAASDENSMDDALKTWKAFDASTKAVVGKINVHGYAGLEAYRGPNRSKLARAAMGKSLWISEYGEKDGTGMTMADSILRDFHELHPSAWIYWQPFDSGGWGLVQCNPSDNWIGPANPKYFVMAQFSRHLRPGMTLLGTADKKSVIAMDAAQKKLVIVTANLDDRGKRVTYELSGFQLAKRKVAHWLTTSDGGQSYAKLDDLDIAGKSFTATFPANCVQTFEIAGIAQ